MGALNYNTPEESNPLDQIVRVAENKSWSVERTNDQEVNAVVSGQWCDFYLSMSWREDLESLHIACSFDVKVPQQRREEVSRLMAMVNCQLFHGHFDHWDLDGTVVYRNSLLLAGSATATDDQCEQLLPTGNRLLPALLSRHPVCQLGWPHSTRRAGLHHV